MKAKIGWLWRKISKMAVIMAKAGGENSMAWR
jgi:hypothetical protein